ncbi:transcription factor grauzone-like [Chironomus tepperi]|uniref:transcription factor grauzone-like n=1 Tax=Chironomus tepperi TaxID=113505 RepID=UPI00391F6C80
MDEEMTKCRLCNYQSDKRLMLGIFEENTEYFVKIENYLNIKIPNTSHYYICFHCSQCIDNFHNFATKIKTIQKIIYPDEQHDEQPQEEEQMFEIQVYHEQPDVIEEPPRIINLETPQITSQKVFMSTVRTRSHVKGKIGISDTTFEELRRIDGQDETLSDQQSHRSFDFEENEENFDTSEAEIYENEEEYKALRDPDDEDFPSAEALKRIPTKLINNGTLIYKSKRLLRMVSTFYNTSCKICENKWFRSIHNLFSHYRSEHPEREPYVTCCSMELTKMTKIIWHFVKHIQPEAFKCKLCDYVVSRPKFLEIHQNTHLPESEKPLECDLCSKRFIWKNALKNHLMKHQTERKLHICNICNKTYQTAGSLSSHKKFTHYSDSNKTRKLCEICSKSFSTLTSYREHLTLHSEDRDKFQLKCPECGRWLKNKRCLKSHLMLHTNVEMRCDICDYVTKKESLLKNHMMTKHSDVKTFICDHPGCDKSFKVKRALSIHKSQNHGGKSSIKKCEFCQREFASSTNYYTHRKNLHAKELQEILEKKNEEEKIKRIKAGLEPIEISRPKIPIIEQTIFHSKDDSIIITLPADAFST